MRKKHIIFIFLVLLSFAGQAQRAAIQRAGEHLQAHELDSAKYYIELAANNSETSTMPLVQYYRGFIYKEIYTTQEKDNSSSPARSEAISSFMLFLQKDTTEKYDESAIKSLDFLGRTLYNDAAMALEAKDTKPAIQNFEEYKVVLNFISPDQDLSDLEIKFALVLGTTYTDIYESDRETNEHYFNKAIEAYETVLSINPRHESANYNLGILYYNEGVNIIKNLPTDVPLPKLIAAQDKTVELFKKSAPNMCVQFLENPCKVETIIGLAGIFWSLNEYEYSDIMMEGLKLLKSNNAAGVQCTMDSQRILKHYEVVQSYYDLHFAPKE